MSELDGQLEGFTDAQRAAILLQMERTPVDKFNTVTVQQWMKYRGCGLKFVDKLLARGWCEPDGVIILGKLGSDVRLCRALKSVFGPIVLSRESVRESLVSGCLSNRKTWPDQFGISAWRRLRDWCGLPEVNPPASGRPWKFDPYTGKKIK